MSSNAVKIQSLIEATFLKAIDSIEREAGNLISDLYVQADNETGELQIYDDNETLLGKVVIFDWIKPDKPAKYDKEVAAIVKAALTRLSSKGLFDNTCFLKPLSVSLTNDTFSVIEELLFLDDELFRLDDPLLKDLDEELDNFLSDLLSDIK